MAIFATLNFADKTYSEFDNSGNAVFETGLTSSFLPATNGDPAYLVLTKTLGSDVCEKKTVDGIQVPSGLSLIFKLINRCVSILPSSSLFNASTLLAIESSVTISKSPDKIPKLPLKTQVS